MSKTVRQGLQAGRAQGMGQPGHWGDAQALGAEQSVGWEGQTSCRRCGMAQAMGC